MVGVQNQTGRMAENKTQKSKMRARFRQNALGVPASICELLLLPLLVSQTPLTVGKNAFAPAANRHSCAVTGNHPADFATVLAGPLHHAVAQFDTDTKERIRNGIGLETAPAAGFRDVAAEVGLKFHHFTGATGDYFMPEIM